MQFYAPQCSTHRPVTSIQLGRQLLTMCGERLHPYLRPVSVMTRRNVVIVFGSEKTIIMRLLSCERISTTYLVLLTQYHSLADRQTETDGQMD